MFLHILNVFSKYLLYCAEIYICPVSGTQKFSNVDFFAPLSSLLYGRNACQTNLLILTKNRDLLLKAVFSICHLLLLFSFIHETICQYAQEPKGHSVSS